jgi:5-methylcytosine-specific restriction endonuclease McrA
MPRITPTGRQSSADILSIKEAVRQRDGYACTRCGLSQAEHVARTGRRLDVHRRTPGSRYVADDCETVCTACHPRGVRRRGGHDEAHGPVVRVRLDAETGARLRRAAAEFGVTPAAFIRHMLAENLPNYERQAENIRAGRPVDAT